MVWGRTNKTDKHLSGQTVGLEKSLVHFEQEDGQLRRADPKDKETNGLWHVVRRDKSFLLRVWELN